jgi:hypothetical protein
VRRLHEVLAEAAVPALTHRGVLEGLGFLRQLSSTRPAVQPRSSGETSVSGRCGQAGSQSITCGDAKAQALAAAAQATVGGNWKRAKRLDGAEHAARSVRRDRIPLQNRNI